MEAPPGLEIRGTKSPPGVVPATRGRGFFSKKAFEPGEQIARFDKPVFALLASRDTRSQCSSCLDVRRQPVQLCTGCRAVAYCSPACQRRHWSGYHKYECKALKRALESAAGAAPDAAAAAAATVPTPVRALMMMMMRYDKDSSMRAHIEGLESNTVAFVREPTLWNDFKIQAAAACRFTGLASEDKIKVAIEILCRIHTNAFDRSDADVGTAGLFLDASLAMVNHACMPNAVVAFSGHTAYLRATQPIAPGDEVTISYIDYTKPRRERQKGLALYNFACTCARCVGDLDVYQVCQALAAAPATRSVVDMNDRFTLVPDVALLRNPPVLARGAPAGPSPQQLQAIYDACDIEHNADPDPADRLAYMRTLWAACQPLVAADRWAMEPLAALVRHTMLYMAEAGNYAHALALACYAAQHIDPYKYPEPFSQWRIKGLLVVAKLLPHIMPVVHPQLSFDGGTAHREATGDEPGSDSLKKVHPGVLAALPDLADGGLYEALMIMTLEQGPKGHSDAWPVLDSARAMLDDVRAAPGREKISAALAQWHADPTAPSMKAFFDLQFMNAINALSSHAIGILKDVLS